MKLFEFNPEQVLTSELLTGELKALNKIIKDDQYSFSIFRIGMKAHKLDPAFKYG